MAVVVNTEMGCTDKAHWRILLQATHSWARRVHLGIRPPVYSALDLRQRQVDIALAHQHSGAPAAPDMRTVLGNLHSAVAANMDHAGRGSPAEANAVAEVGIAYTGFDFDTGTTWQNK